MTVCGSKAQKAKPHFLGPDTKSFSGARTKNRTWNLDIKSVLLCQLSYAGAVYKVLSPVSEISTKHSVYHTLNAKADELCVHIDCQISAKVSKRALIGFIKEANYIKIPIHRQENPSQTTQKGTGTKLVLDLSLLINFEVVHGAGGGT